MKLNFLNRFRIKQGQFTSKDTDQFGMFQIPSPKHGGQKLLVMAAPFDNPYMGWEHVSVSLPHRCPTWEEMCFIKELFWNDEQTVVQFHPPKSVYVNNHSFCLHLWRRCDIEFPLPPIECVGVK
jgi:hypothetical protein